MAELLTSRLTKLTHFLIVFSKGGGWVALWYITYGLKVASSILVHGSLGERDTTLLLTLAKLYCL